MPEPKVWLPTSGMLISISGTTDDVSKRLEISGTKTMINQRRYSGIVYGFWFEGDIGAMTQRAFEFLFDQC